MHVAKGLEAGVELQGSTDAALNGTAARGNGIAMDAAGKMYSPPRCTWPSVSRSLRCSCQWRARERVQSTVRAGGPQSCRCGM